MEGKTPFYAPVPVGPQAPSHLRSIPDLYDDLPHFGRGGARRPEVDVHAQLHGARATARRASTRAGRPGKGGRPLSVSMEGRSPVAKPTARERREWTPVGRGGGTFFGERGRLGGGRPKITDNNGPAESN